MRNRSLTSSLIASLIVHVVVISLGSAFPVGKNEFAQRNFVPIELMDLPRVERVENKIAFQESRKKVIQKPPAPPPKVEPAKEPKSVAKAEPLEPQRALPPATPPKEEPVKTVEATPSVSARAEPPPRFDPKESAAGVPAPAEEPPAFFSGARIEGRGSDAGAGNLFEQGDVAVVPGSGISGGGGGTAISGLGRGSGPPGLPAEPRVLRTRREAKPVHSARASYPPLALRMGVEGDVTLRIEVDTEGNVTKAELVRTAGMGFDEEALKAVKQSRFEPAQQNGRNVPAEFTYIYRFRLAK